MHTLLVLGRQHTINNSLRIDNGLQAPTFFLGAGTCVLFGRQGPVISAVLNGPEALSPHPSWLCSGGQSLPVLYRDRKYLPLTVEARLLALKLGTAEAPFFLQTLYKTCC